MIATRQQSAGFVGTSLGSSDICDVLVLFGQGRDWDEREYSHSRHQGKFRFHHEGFDLFSFPSNARLMWFDILRFVDRMSAKYAGRVQAVVSNNEQFGALAAALIAQRLGLPGTRPQAILLAQHKFHMREQLKLTMAETNPGYSVFPYTFERECDLGIEFPFFVKPIKAAYSVLARRVDTFEELREHMTFRPFEKHIIKRLVRPFNDAFVMHGGIETNGVDAHWMIGETLLQGEQINVDGLVFDGECHVLGIVDAVMYPGTQAFMRFDYPSRLPEKLQEMVRQLACRAMQAMGHDHGFFNIEMTVDRSSGAIKIIEINPRMADQFSRLYARIDGLNLHDIGLAMALNHRPDAVRKTMPDRVGSSFVFRRFDLENLPSPPTPAQRAWLATFAPHAILADFFKTGSQLAREMKWLGSYRYAVLNLTAESEAALMDKYEAIRLRMGFDVSAEAHLKAPRTLS